MPRSGNFAKQNYLTGRDLAPHHFLDAISKGTLTNNTIKNDFVFYGLRIKSGGG